MSDWIMITTVALNIIVILGAGISLFVKFGKWEERLNDTCRSIEDIQVILSDQAKCIKEHEGRISYLEGLEEVKKK